MTAARFTWRVFGFGLILRPDCVIFLFPFFAVEFDRVIEHEPYE